MNHGLKKGRLYYANHKGKEGTWNFNCWGATLYVLGIEPRLLWVSEGHMKRTLDMKTEKYDAKKMEQYSELPSTLQPGDIVALWDSVILEHTAVYMGSSKFFHKKGPNISEITDIHGVIVSYKTCSKLEYRRLI